MEGRGSLIQTFKVAAETVKTGHRSKKPKSGCFGGCKLLCVAELLQVLWPAAECGSLPFIRRYFYPARLTQDKFRLCPRAKWKWTLFPEEKLDTCFLYFHSAVTFRGTAVGHRAPS